MGKSKQKGKTPSPTSSGSGGSRLTTAQAENQSSVLAAEADKISAQARLEQAAAKRQKVDGSLELRREEEKALRAERVQKQQHDMEMERRKLAMEEKKLEEQRKDRDAQRAHDAKMLEIMERLAQR
eukprot:COSAG02_NODE_9276_length_2269_cov_2.858525_2_plen_126_part_00